MQVVKKILGVFKKNLKILFIILFFILAIFLLVVVFNRWKLNNIVFELNEEGYEYQIVKCWKTDPPTYWIQRFEYNNPGKFKVGNCTFLGEAIQISQSSVDFNKRLNIALEITGELKDGLFKNYYIVRSIKTAKRKLSKPQKLAPKKPKDYLIIRRVEDNGEIKTIYKKEKDLGHSLIKWQNNLFFEISPDSSPSGFLARHDLKTGETEVVLEKVNEYETGRSPYYLMFINVIENELYFSFGAYLTARKMFYLSSANSKPKQIKKNDLSWGFSKIEEKSGYYIASGGEGDGCGGMGFYALFNPYTKTTLPKIESYFGCADGEEVLGFDNQKRAIVANHVRTENDQPANQVYTYIATIPLLNPSQKNILVNKEDMPRNISLISYSEEYSQLVLIGKEVYVFDLKNGRLNKVSEINKDWDNPRIYNWHNSLLCLSNYGMQNGKPIESQQVNLQDGTILENTDYCKSDFSKYMPQDQAKSANQTIRSLDLPQEYQIGIVTE